MPPLLADFIYNRVCKLQTKVRKILDTTYISVQVWNMYRQRI